MTKADIKKLQKEIRVCKEKLKQEAKYYTNISNKYCELYDTHDDLKKEFKEYKEASERQVDLLQSSINDYKQYYDDSFEEV